MIPGKPLSVELETFHHAMLERDAVHVRESKWRLEQSMRSGWFATTWGNTLLRLADWMWPITNWVRLPLHRHRVSSGRADSR